jgi:hypothetical protein
VWGGVARRAEGLEYAEASGRAGQNAKEKMRPTAASYGALSREKSGGTGVMDGFRCWIGRTGWEVGGGRRKGGRWIMSCDGWLPEGGSQQNHGRDRIMTVWLR